jgi:hypothetical protein
MSAKPVLLRAGYAGAKNQRHCQKRCARRKGALRGIILVSGFFTGIAAESKKAIQPV